MIDAAEELGTRQMNKNHAELRLRFFSSQHLVPEQILEECELRDAIFSFALAHFLRYSVVTF